MLHPRKKLIHESFSSYQNTTLRNSRNFSGLYTCIFNSGFAELLHGVLPAAILEAHSGDSLANLLNSVHFELNGNRFRTDFWFAGCRRRVVVSFEIRIDERGKLLLPYRLRFRSNCRLLESKVEILRLLDLSRSRGQ